MSTKLRTKRSPFGSYRAYISSLQALMNETGRLSEWDERVVAALNGEASTELQRVASLEVRRKYGAYFTGTPLSERLLKRCKSFAQNGTFYDPTCGMGDLLLAAAKRLPLARTLPETLTQWGRRLAGTDLHTEFITGTKTRLVLLARQLHHTVEPTPAAGLFPQIRVADGLAKQAGFQHAMTLLLNPPFGLINAPIGCGWAGGRISEAATFTIASLERCRAGTEVLAILPEVLRSGSFSEHWRNRVGELAEVHLVEPYGVFDDSADIDVFLLRLIRRAKDNPTRKKPWPTQIITRQSTVAGSFHVHVGRVVPHRDKQTGPRYPYLHPRCVPAWEVMKDFCETRRHKGLAYEPPFVVIRRTSRPGNAYRATATVIACKRPVAVENHLIVCEPKDGTLATCRHLMRQLKTKAVNEYLDARIRCRHLTVNAVATIPLKSV